MKKVEKNKSKVKHINLIRSESKAIFYVVICLIIIMIGASYALFFQVSHNEDNQIVKAGSLEFNYLQGNTITNANNNRCFAPLNLDKSNILLECAYQIKVTNNGTIPSNYKITLNKLDTNTMELDKIKILLKKQNGDNLEIVSGYPKAVSDLRNNNLLVDDIINPNESVLYAVSLYVEESLITMDDNGKVIGFNLNGVGELAPNLDINGEDILHGANPVITGDLIPVTISMDGTVKKADTSKPWYDYNINKKEWANAIILNDKSINYEVEQVIPEDNIESYFVWIPRYRYRIFNDGNYETRTVVEQKEQPIDIIFESKDVAPSIGTKKGEWLTHPAFTTFNVNGMWVGKFETGKKSGEDNVVAPSQVQIKPNVSSWRNIQVANAFYSVYDYQRTLDSHMMKNTEWGAVAYLSMSNYGRGVEDIRMNNNSNYITGYAAVNAPTCGYTGTNDTCNKYGTSADITKPYNTDIGVLASTTGNISGIYDMSGGAWEYVMGVMLDKTNTRPVTGYNSSNNSNFNGPYSETGEKTNGLDWPDPKYYDTYASPTGNDRFDRRILGDATGEMGPFGTATYGNQARNISSWYADHANFVYSAYPWFVRGDMFNEGTNAGVSAFGYYYGATNGRFGFRVVLMP